MTVTWGAAARAKRGFAVSGDTYLVCQEDHRLLVAVIDGLGGGEEAARAAHAASAIYARQPWQSLQELVRASHEDLRNTRGAVVGLLRVDLANPAASFVGVGNIGVHAYSRRPIKPISKNGILGYRLPTLLELSYAYDPGDTFVLYSDGISSQFAHDDTIERSQPPQQIAEQVLERYGKQSDDATVVVIKTSP